MRRNLLSYCFDQKLPRISPPTVTLHGLNSCQSLLHLGYIALNTCIIRVLLVSKYQLYVGICHRVPRIIEYLVCPSPERYCYFPVFPPYSAFSDHLNLRILPFKSRFLPPIALPPQSTTILASAKPFGSTVSKTLGLTTMSYSLQPSHVLTMVAEFVSPVAGLRMLIEVPQMGLSFGLAGLFIISVDNATMASELELV